ncbi:transcriptional regulator PhoU [Methylomonas lenta]|uniref:Phosphate-specific transport system accessory protein PhoU n=1 Tax=Methylomonas lenta TaxID=980561 RepID=A0A177NBT8_9GAMM|nr:phosphate signaling complex protein PhoU [Methylomonas lenta]OAI15477.1 transcriptional regulator PhoU [Methylomonas lenta]
MDNMIIKQHISRQFNNEMEQIRNKVLAMGGLVEEQVELATKAFMSSDAESAEKVIEQDQLINALEKDIDHECTEIMAKRQPAAFDLRMLIATLKIITDLERIGDEATRIAKMAMRLEGGEFYQDKYFEIEHLLDMVKEMLNGALDSYARTDTEELVAITAQDSKVDREYGSITRQLITQMMEDPRNITRALDVLWTARALERIGDHACNVCEHVIYMVKGKDVRHLSHEELTRTVNETSKIGR